MCYNKIISVNSINILIESIVCSMCISCNQICYWINPMGMTRLNVTVQHVTLLNNVGSCNTVVIVIILQCYNIIILWDHRCICGLSTETSLCGAYLYVFNV